MRSKGFVQKRSRDTFRLSQPYWTFKIDIKSTVRRKSGNVLISLTTASSRLLTVFCHDPKTLIIDTVCPSEITDCTPVSALRKFEIARNAHLTSRATGQHARKCAEREKAVLHSYLRVFRCYTLCRPSISLE